MLKASTRFIGIDIARFLAIVGMMAAHLLVPSGSPRWVEIVTSGFPSTLFAILGGFGVAFSTRRYANNNWAAFVATFMRGLVVFLIGWVCEALPPSPIALILVYFGMAIMCAAFLVALSNRVLMVIAAILALVGPQLLPVFRANLDTVGLLDLTNPPATMRSLFFSGTYPVVTWLAYIIIGMIICRLLLKVADQKVSGAGNTQTFALWLIGGGAGVGLVAFAISEISLRTFIGPRVANYFGLSESQAIESLHRSQYGAMPQNGWMAALVASPHSGATMDILLTGGVSVAIIGLAILATAKMTGVPLLLQPITRDGAAPLTIYVAHILMTSIMYEVLFSSPQWQMGEFPVWFKTAFWWQLAVVTVIGIILTALRRRGPLETFTSSVSHAFADFVLEYQKKSMVKCAPKLENSEDKKTAARNEASEKGDGEFAPVFLPVNSDVEKAPDSSEPTASPLPSRRDFHGRNRGYKDDSRDINDLS